MNAKARANLTERACAALFVVTSERLIIKFTIVSCPDNARPFFYKGVGTSGQMSRAAALMCTVLFSTITSARCGNLSACVDVEEWMSLEQAIGDSGCAEKLVDRSLVVFMRGNHAFDNRPILDQEVHLCQVFVRLTSMLVTKNRLGDLCEMGVVDHETMPPQPCAQTADLVHLATALQKKDDPIFSATAEVLQTWKEEVVCETTCAPGLGAALCNGIIKLARKLVMLTIIEKGVGKALVSAYSELGTLLSKYN